MCSNDAEDLDVKPYAVWSPVRVADPRAATPEQFLDGFRKICADEGPIIEDRLYALYARAAELGRVYGPVRQKFERALQTAVEAKHLIASRETFGVHDERVITLPDQRPVSMRERGPRSLHEIPGTEIAEVMLAIRVEHDLIGRDELLRAVLAAYKLKRLSWMPYLSGSLTGGGNGSANHDVVLAEGAAAETFGGGLSPGLRQRRRI